MVALVAKIIIAIIAMMLHIKAGMAVAVIIVINEIIDYFMTHSIVRQAIDERSKK